PRRKRWTLGVGGSDPLGAVANAVSVPPGEYGRRLKLKGIAGGPHKRWSMWSNSKQREEPYLGLTCWGKPVETSAPLRSASTGAAWLSSARVGRWWVKSRNEPTPRPRSPAVRPATQGGR